jgi:hypothetical protein
MNTEGDNVINTWCIGLAMVQKKTAGYQAINYLIIKLWTSGW